MITWLKRLGFIAGIVIILEVVVWISVALFGDDWLQKFKDYYVSKKPTPAVERDDGKTIEKCSTYDGNLFCIKEEK